IVSVRGIEAVPHRQLVTDDETPVPRRWGELIIQLLLQGCALISILTTVGIVLVLVVEAAQFFRDVSVIEFLTGTEWSPKLGHKFGILPLLSGAMLVTVGAAVIALPIGL